MKSRKDDRHATDAAVLVRMTAAERDQIAEAVRIMNERARPDGGRYYMGSFMLAAALRTAEKVIGGRTTRRPT